MRIVLLFLLISYSFCFTEKQIKVIRYVWNKSKPFNLQYTLTSICIVESNAGSYLLNLKDPSCGIFHIMPSTLSNSYWEQSRICERLIKDNDFSFSVALKRFKYFYNYWISKGYSKSVSWKRAICSYNAGWNWKNGLKYYKKVVKIMKFISRNKKNLKLK